MYSINAIIQKNKRNKKKQYPIYVRLTVSRLHSYFNTGLKVEEQYWDKKKRRIKSSYPNSNAANFLISKLYTEIEAECIRLNTDGILFTASSIKENLQNNSNNDFFDYAKEWIKIRKNRQIIKLGTQLRYNAVLEKLSEYSGGKLNISDFNYNYLLKYESYLSTSKLNNSINTISANFKMFRAIFKDLVNDGKVNMMNNPFNRYTFRSTDVKIKYLEEDQIRKIENIFLPNKSKINESRDIFLFCLNTGFRIGDALKLRLKDIGDKHYSFKAQKTESDISMYKTTEAIDIIEPYLKDKTADDFVFSFLAKVDLLDEVQYYKAQKSATALINKNLGIISQRLEFAFNVSTHYARHSLAKIGLKNGLSMEEIQAILHHKDIRTTQIYATAVKEMTDNAMQKFTNSMKSSAQ